MSNIVHKKDFEPTARNVHTMESRIYATLQREEARQLYEAEHGNFEPPPPNDDDWAPDAPLSEEEQDKMFREQDER